ncbi:type II secretion system F family protein [Vibrio bivalvicida]|uniref:Pilus assembly protein TadB n=1 Tax=Vibrio bivalvicida TaxID=1276888 RepID=A0A177XXT6_9VIBR|nr:type II secretion system F family protein [Vibrio bivalvicida]OAJ93407.1 pilus assembly protein TadB [Vibrio bivalvicida]
MILVLVFAVVFFLLAFLYLLRQHSAKKVVKQRVDSVALSPRHGGELSIVKKATSNGIVRSLFARLDALFSRSDKFALTLGMFALPCLSFYFVTEIAWLWRISSGLTTGLLVCCALYIVRKRQQSEEFERDITQVLGLISRAVSAGLSVPQAIEQVAQSQSGLLGREFLLIQDQLSLGRSLRSTLDEACARLPYKAFRYFSVALILNQSNGGQLRDILHSLSRTLHDNRAMQKKVKSLTSEPRMTARFLSILPFALLGVVAWMDPSLFSLLIDTESGQAVLIYCGISILIGAALLQALTKNRRFS